jgi:hypothetical protein
MKTLIKASDQSIKTLMLAVLICFASSIMYAQITVVQFMKVKPGQWSTYLEMEEAWSKLHQKSVDNGYLLEWSLYEKMFHGTEDEYDFITINVYPDWATYEKGLPDGYYDQLGEAIMTKTGESRSMVRAEVYSMVVGADNSGPSKFIMLAFMKVEQGNTSAYVDMESKYYKVYHEGLIEAGGMNSWGIYQRSVPFGFGGEYNYVATNGYESLSQPNSITQEANAAAWEKAAAGTPDDAINKLTNETRVMVTSEVWRYIIGVAASE